MDVKRVVEADRVIEWLADQANSLPDDRKNGVLMALHLQMTRCYLIEFARALADGDEPYDALLKAARGETKLTEGPSLTTFRLLSAKPPPDRES